MQVWLGSKGATFFIHYLILCHMPMFSETLPGFLAAYKHKVSDSHMPQQASRTLCETFSAYYNLAKDNFTTAENVLVGIHTRSVLFLLQLAITTCNQIAENRQPQIVLQMCNDSFTQSSEDASNNINLRVHQTQFPQSSKACAEYVHSNPPQILIAQITPHFTKNIWSSAVVIFPVTTDSHLRYAYRAVKCVLKDLLSETGALPTLPIQRATTLACSPWMLAYEARCRRFVQIVTDVTVKTCVQYGFVVRRAKSMANYDATYTVGIEMENAHVSTQQLTQLKKKGVIVEMLSGTTRVRIIFDGLLNGPAALEAMSIVDSVPKAVDSWKPNRAFLNQHVGTLQTVIKSIFLS